MDNKLLEVKGLTVAFKEDKVVNDISFDVLAGETFALVGESGSGKSITALSVLRLLPNNAKVSANGMLLDSENLLTIPEYDFCKIRGKRIGLIFQDPMSSLNPVMTIGQQIAEVMQIHFNYSEKELNLAVHELLEQVEIPEPKRRINE